MIRALFALGITLLLAAPAPAADPPSPPQTGLDYTTPAPPAPPDPAGLVMRLVGLTAGLIAACGVVVWLAKRSNRPAPATGDPTRLTHEGTLALGRRAAIHLLRADGQQVVVTTDATGIGSIVVLSEPFEDALSAETDSPGAAN
jgi:hypothetical protein